MALDIAMGGSTNTILHLLAAAHEAELDYTLTDIDQPSRRVPCLCKAAPNGTYLMEDVHCAGGMPAILGELQRGGLPDENVNSIHAPSLQEWLARWDIRSEDPSPEQPSWSTPRKTPATSSSTNASKPATSSWSAMKARAAVPACRKCCTRRPS